MRGEPGYAGELAAYQKTEVRGQKPEGVCSFAGGLKSRSPGERLGWLANPNNFNRLRWGSQAQPKTYVTDV